MTTRLSGARERASVPARLFPAITTPHALPLRHGQRDDGLTNAGPGPPGHVMLAGGGSTLQHATWQVRRLSGHAGCGGPLVVCLVASLSAAKRA